MPAEAEPPSSYGRFGDPTSQEAEEQSAHAAYWPNDAAGAQQWAVGVLAAADGAAGVVDAMEEGNISGRRDSKQQPREPQPETLGHRIFTIAVAGTGVRACVRCSVGAALTYLLS